MFRDWHRRWPATWSRCCARRHPNAGTIEGQALGAIPVANVPRVVPSLARNLVTLSLPKLVTQMLAPSKATPSGEVPTAYVPNAPPSQTRSLLTLLPALFATQMLAPSNAKPNGNCHTNLAVRFALYQCKRAIWRKFIIGSLAGEDYLVLAQRTFGFCSRPLTIQVVGPHCPRQATTPMRSALDSLRVSGPYRAPSRLATAAGAPPLSGKPPQSAPVHMADLKNDRIRTDGIVPGQLGLTSTGTQQTQYDRVVCSPRHGSPFGGVVEKQHYRPNDCDRLRVSYPAVVQTELSRGQR